MRPLIHHYNDSCDAKETIFGEYTPYGIRLVTRGFSPFTVDVSSRMPAGDVNGSGQRTVEDMQSLYSYLATASMEETGIKDEDDFAAMADYNGDGSVNILDYQALYEIVKK